MQHEYDVFLSFSSTDEVLAKRVWTEMSLSGLRVFWSDESLKSNIGESFFTIIQEALEKSKHFVLICTNNAMKSHWVREEYETFCNNCYIPSGRKRKLIIYKTDSCKKNNIPFLLKNIQLTESIDLIIKILGIKSSSVLAEGNIKLVAEIKHLRKKILDFDNKVKKLENEKLKLFDVINIKEKNNKFLKDKLSIYQEQMRNHSYGKDKTQKKSKRLDADTKSEPKDPPAVETLLPEDKSNDSDEIDSTLVSDKNFEEDDVLKEVDVYIVYGLHEQAEDELIEAITRNPNNMEYRFKLLENYKAAYDAESFVSSAKDFLKASGNNKEQLWDKVVVWGKEIAPENGLFAEASLKSAMNMAAGDAGIGANEPSAKKYMDKEGMEDIIGNIFDKILTGSKKS